MIQLVINIEDKKILPSLKKVLGALEGVSIAKPAKKTTHKTELDLAIEEVEKGQVTRWESVDAFIDHINNIAK